MRQSRTDPVATAHTMLSAFCLDQLLTSESGLSLYLAIWSRLRTDCSDILYWIKNPAGQSVSPLLNIYFESPIVESCSHRMFPPSFYHIWRVVVRFMLRWLLLLMFLQRVSILLSTLVNAKNAGINIIIVSEAIFFLLCL
jgi:hypothetical protein